MENTEYTDYTDKDLVKSLSWNIDSLTGIFAECDKRKIRVSIYIVGSPNDASIEHCHRLHVAKAVKSSVLLDINEDTTQNSV